MLLLAFILWPGLILGLLILSVILGLFASLIK